MKRAALLCSLLIALAGCSGHIDYVDWLYEYMPLPDSLQYPRSYWEANVSKTLEVREKMGWKVPEREFRHFVLPLRVNNETLDDFRTVYADTLCSRVRGLSLTEAALEINHWCHEQASYEPSDGRTSAPMATVRRGVGRCGEESVLTVSALRAAGIPARQVYTPRWAHTDDNHAWVEVYTEDGHWHFLGACEPAPTLDNAWFNGPVSRALLLHTKVFGDYDGPEDVIQRTPCYTEINVIRGYVPARRTVVTVLDGDVPAEGATVGFTIYNYAEFYTVATYNTGADGTAALDTGLGDMLVWAQKGERFGFAKAGSDAVSVSLDHSIGERFSADVNIVPPPEDPIPSGATPEQEEANKLRLACEDAIRDSHPHNNPDADAFVAEHGDRGRLLLGMISAKDRGDVTREVLEDALLVNSDAPDVLSPRVELEPLRPFRAEVLASGIAERLHSPEEVAQWVRDSIRIVEGRNPQGLRTAPIAVWRARVADSRACDIFYVALCRALGFPAGIDPVTGKVQEARQDKGTAVLYSEDKSAAPEYYRHFTLTSLSAEGSRLLEYPEGSKADMTLDLDPGYYILTSGNRQLDGSVPVHLEFFSVGDDNPVARLPIVLRTASAERKILGKVDIGERPAGHYLVVIPGNFDEPTNHALRDLIAASEALGPMLKGVLFIPPADSYSALLEEAESRYANSEEFLDIVIEGSTYPIVALCDESGNIYYISRGYNTSLASDLKTVL